jgi:hypothetical protein
VAARGGAWKRAATRGVRRSLGPHVSQQLTCARPAAACSRLCVRRSPPPTPTGRCPTC